MSTEITTTPGSDLGEVTITREFDAPRELVFGAFMDPAQLCRFWGPTGTHTPLESITLEPWPGGRFETVMVADDGSGEYPTASTFVEVDPPGRFSFSEPGGMLTTSTLTDLGDGRTRLVIHQTNVPEMYRSPEALAGFSTSLDRFEAYLATVVR